MHLNTEKVLYCFYKMLLRNTRVSETSQHWLHTPTKGRYVFYWRGWAGTSEGRIICKYFTDWGGSNLFYICNRGRVIVFW